MAAAGGGGNGAGAARRDTVKLVSAEGFEFIVDYKAACVSNTIKNMLSSQGNCARVDDARARLCVVCARARILSRAPAADESFGAAFFT